MAERQRKGIWAGLRAFHWGEASLWFAFAVAVLAAAGSTSGRETSVTLAGVFALAAIGVRATRPDPRNDDAQA